MPVDSARKSVYAKRASRRLVGVTRSDGLNTWRGIVVRKLSDRLEKIARELHGALTEDEREALALAIATLRSGRGDPTKPRRPRKKKPAG